MTPCRHTALLILIVGLLTAGAAVASVLEKSVAPPHTRPLARFDHDAHNADAQLNESCNLCHHRFDETGHRLAAESSEEMACRECHDSGKKGTPKTVAAFHNRCKGCHIAVRKGPIACGQCHVAGPESMPPAARG